MLLLWVDLDRKPKPEVCADADNTDDRLLYCNVMGLSCARSNNFLLGARPEVVRRSHQPPVRLR